MKLVFNPSSSPVVYDDDGHMVDPETWAYVDDDGTNVQRLINDGALVDVVIPEKMPESVDPRAYTALQAAVDDKAPAPVEQTGDTDARTSRRTNRNATSKEA